MSIPPPPTYDTYKIGSSPVNDDVMIKLHEIAPIACGVPPPPPYMPHIPAAIVPGPGPAAIVPGPGPAAIVPEPGGLLHGIPVSRRVLGAAVAVTIVGGILAVLPRNDNHCYRHDNGNSFCIINWLNKPCVSNEDGNMVCPSLCVTNELGNMVCPSFSQDSTTLSPGPRQTPFF